MNRSLRRHHRERLKNKRRKYNHYTGSEKSLGIIIDTPAVCSCRACGNPRKHVNRITRQEYNSNIKHQEEMLDAGIYCQNKRLTYKD